MSVQEKLSLAVSQLLEKSGSDIHIPSDQPVSIRIHGQLTKLPIQFSPEETKELYAYLKQKFLTGEQQRFADERFSSLGHVGFSIEYEISSGRIQRFRVNISRQGEGYYTVLREIKDNPPPLTTLGFTERALTGLRYVETRPAGLFLVVGSTGSGKSTTLASMIQEINEQRAVNIITLEDPIEYRHKPKLAQIVQKELGRDFPRFSEGLHSALREDPDIILVGEIRDPNSFELCLKAAETGHLVFATLHTNDAVTTIDRLVSMAGENAKEYIRSRLSQVLLGVLAQRLAPRKDSKGRVLVYELFIANTSALNLIKEGKEEQIRALMDNLSFSNGHSLSESFNKNIIRLLKKGVITPETAKLITNDLTDLIERARADVEIDKKVLQELETAGTFLNISSSVPADTGIVLEEEEI